MQSFSLSSKSGKRSEELSAVVLSPMEGFGPVVGTVVSMIRVVSVPAQSLTIESSCIVCPTRKPMVVGGRPRPKCMDNLDKMVSEKFILSRLAGSRRIYYPDISVTHLCASYKRTLL